MDRPFYHKDFRLGILGGGQLGRMLIQKALDLDIRTKVLDPSPDAPCSPIAHEFVEGSLTDKETVLEFGKDVDILTIEIENVNVEALEELEQQGVTVHPQPFVIKMIQDKGVQKNFFDGHGIPTVEYMLINSKRELREYSDKLPMVQKVRRGGYDGRGVMVLETPLNIDEAFDKPSVVEDKVDIDKEISVIVARNPSDEVQVFPVVELDFDPDANLVRTLFSPADISEKCEDKAFQIAEKIAEKFGIVGVLAIEMFVTKNGEVLVNEVAPRPHNSGHHTIEANFTSQYEQHLRAILDLPLGDTAALIPAAMTNLLGSREGEGVPYYEEIEDVIEVLGAHVHLYGKGKTKPDRKMGHVTILDHDLKEARKKADLVWERSRIVPIKES